MFRRSTARAGKELGEHARKAKQLLAEYMDGVLSFDRSKRPGELGFFRVFRKNEKALRERFGDVVDHVYEFLFDNEDNGTNLGSLAPYDADYFSYLIERTTEVVDFINREYRQAPRPPPQSIPVPGTTVSAAVSRVCAAAHILLLFLVFALAFLCPSDGGRPGGGGGGGSL
jgi:hypothetical protein